MVIKMQMLDMPEGEAVFKTFTGDELTSPVSEAIIYLQELQQKELEL